MRSIRRSLFRPLWWSLVLGMLSSGVAGAVSSPTKTVQLFLEAHRRGRFAEARGYTLEQVNLHASLFSNWLFAGSGLRPESGTADIFLSRKFTDAFRYTITGTTPGGSNHAFVTAIRKSPNILHMYTWALAPRRGAAPYALIEAVDAYLTKVNYPIEESRMRFTLIREVGDWYISAVHDEKFAQLQQQFLSQPVASVVPAPAAAPAAPGADTPAAPSATTTSDDRGRLLADAQFNATLQSFNAPRPTAVSAAPEKPRDDRSLLQKIFGLGTSKNRKSTIMADIKNPNLSSTFNNIRKAFELYSGGHQEFPRSEDIYNWQSLRRVVNRYSKVDLPPTEEEAGFKFIKYVTRSGEVADDYILLVELQKPENGLTRVEVTPLGVDRAN